MSAPSIPNLLSLRGRGGRGGGRGGRGRGGRPGSASAAHDATIQGTDTDAAVSRLSAVEQGYLDDPYAEYFVHSADGPPARRLPIINRGMSTCGGLLGRWRMLEVWKLTRTDWVIRDIYAHSGAGYTNRRLPLRGRRHRVYHGAEADHLTGRRHGHEAVPSILAAGLPGSYLP